MMSQMYDIIRGGREIGECLNDESDSDSGSDSTFFSDSTKSFTFPDHTIDQLLNDHDDGYVLDTS